jgi:PPM family protein phosphatase
MTLALRYAVRSDVGLLREGNEDSAYAGPHLLAVADGMGGHAAGEVASAATITTIAPLDESDPGPDLAGALADAVATANLRLQELIVSDPAIEGMGTTLTALLWSEDYAALCHIGDSRAYVLRDGEFMQITHDHTLVQSLVDEGKITEDDVATHPHRSLLLRALDGRTIAEPDLSNLETFPGDRYLLCSDGLSGVVTEQTLHQTLSSIRDPDKAALRLIELAIKGGGPDNITCIVADVIDERSSRVPPTWQPVFAGAAANGAPSDLRPPARQSSPATRAMRLTRTAPQPAIPDEPTTGVWSAGQAYREPYTGAFETPFDSGGFDRTDGRADRDGRDWVRDTASFDQADSFAGQDGDRGRAAADDWGPRRRGGHRARHQRRDEDDDYGQQGHQGRRRWPIVTGALVLLVLLVAGGGYGFWRYNQSQYYVGVSQNGYVAIFRGTNQSLAGINMSSMLQSTPLPVSQLTSSDRALVTQAISQQSVTAAQAVVNQLQTHATQCKLQWQALQMWQARDRTFLTEEANPKTKTQALQDYPGMIPTQPDPDCAASTAFGVPVSALPAPGTTTPPSPQPTPTRPTTSPSGKATAKATASPTPQAANG